MFVDLRSEIIEIIASDFFSNLINLVFDLATMARKTEEDPSSVFVKYSKVKFNEILMNERIIKFED